MPLCVKWVSILPSVFSPASLSHHICHRSAANRLLASESVMDMDIDDLGGGPSKPVPKRPSKFLPKSKQKPKPEQIQPEPNPPRPDVPKQEDIKPSFDATIVKREAELAVENVIDSLDDVEFTDDPVQEEGGLNEDWMVEDNNKQQQEEEKVEEEDVVVREIDVYFNPTVDDGTQLYVMQYPLRPYWRSYRLDERCQEVRVKPKSLKVEIDLSLNLEKNYDNNAADGLMIDKQTLSSWKPTTTSGYAVGILRGNKLYVNPVNAVVQLRPSMEHLNRDRMKKKPTVTQNVPGKEPLKQGQMESTSAEDAESWVSLDYYDKDSIFSTTYRQKMTSPESSEIQFSMAPSQYLNSLCPGFSANAGKSLHHYMRLFRSLPLEERFRKWFSEGPQINRFDSLKHLAPDESDEHLLEIIQRHAILLQGLWVSRTSLFQFTQKNDAIARDYLLLLFKESPEVSNIKLRAISKLKENMMRIVKTFAVERELLADWKFKEPSDNSFKKVHPDVFEKQKIEWQNLEMKVMKVLPKAMVTSTNNKPRTTADVDTGAKTHNGAPGPSTVHVSNEARKAMTKVLEEILRKHNVCSMNLIQEDLRENALFKSSFPKADARSARALADFRPELRDVLSQVAREIHGVYALKLLGDPNLDPLRNVVMDLLCGMEPKAKLKRADVVEAVKVKLNKDITTREYTQIVSQLCVSVKGNAWILRSGDGNPE